LRPLPAPTTGKESVLELPQQHQIPLTWLLEHGGPSIRYRVLQDLAPEGYASPEVLAEAAEAVRSSRPAASIAKKQRPTGIWAGNIMGLAPSAAQGIRDVGTVAQYRRLLQLGWPADDRTFKLTTRVLFRLLSRDPDPALLFEFKKTVKDAPLTEAWVRNNLREAASTALAEAGFNIDPRLRGSAHRTASAISNFLRSPEAEKPFVKVGQTYALHPEAYPPTWYSLAMMASMPNLQRERAGFTERLGQYLAQPAPKRPVIIKFGKKTFRPAHVLLGNPIKADARGVTTDIPLALHLINILARIDALHTAPTATRVLVRLLKDCDDTGVWHPKNLRSQPKGADKASCHFFPLVPVDKTATSRQVDITFRLALTAKLLDWDLDYT
jgi:hypothetical protein